MASNGRVLKPGKPITKDPLFPKYEGRLQGTVDAGVANATFQGDGRLGTQTCNHFIWNDWRIYMNEHETHAIKPNFEVKLPLMEYKLVVIPMNGETRVYEKVQTTQGEQRARTF